MSYQREFKKAGLLNQKKAIWLCSVRKSPFWVTPHNAPYFRPYLLIIFDVTMDKIRHVEAVDKISNPDEVLMHLFKAMLKPMPGSGKRCRPESIAFEDNSLADALSGRLKELNIRSEVRPGMNLIDKALKDFTDFQSEGRPQPALVDIPQITVPLMEEFYKSADVYYRAAPWANLTDENPIKIEYDGVIRYVAVMGNAGESFGLAAYNTLEDLERVYEIDEPSETANLLNMSVTYDNPRFMSYRDLDEIEKRNWPIAGELAYPLALKVDLPDRVTTLTLAEVEWFAAALKVLPDFISNQIRIDADVVNPVKKIYTLSGIHNQKTASCTFPVLEHLDEKDAVFIEIADSFVKGWDCDDESTNFAGQVSILMVGFLQDLLTNGLSMNTVKRHEENCWWIGKFMCEMYGGKPFSFDLFYQEPQFVQEFTDEVSKARSRIDSYCTTWRKLSRYAYLVESSAEDDLE